MVATRFLGKSMGGTKHFSKSMDAIEPIDSLQQRPCDYFLPFGRVGEEDNGENIYKNLDFKQNESWYSCWLTQFLNIDTFDYFTLKKNS